ncbi:MAG: TatD family hydrolase [Phycisphaerales bacterium]|nr:TatD family hydrolase [Phycisphaerales bacterium]
MGLIDSHAHLTRGPLASDVAGALDRAVAAGVEHIICIGVDLADARCVIALAQSDRRVSAGVGIHPHEAGRVNETEWGEWPELIRLPVVVAVGEMGLDYHYDFADRGAQRQVFERQLAMASAVDKPIVIHCRDAHSDTLAVLKSAGYAGKRVVFHCYTGTAAEAAEIADLGWRTSFTGIVTFKNSAEIATMATGYPVDHLMIETDSPYLSPEPVRHVRPNEPAHLAHTARFLAARRRVDFEAFAQQTAANTRAFYGLPG